MMLSIMSLIRETLSSQNDAKTETHGATALKREPAEFDAMLSNTPAAAPCNSMARIKTKTSNAQTQADDDESPDSTRCMSPDDFMAWAFNAKSATQTIPSPELEVTSSRTLPKMNAVNANELPSKSSIIAADMHDIDEPAAQSDHEIRPQASILEPAPATERVSIGKLARSKNATEVPPPSVLPMIDADDVMPTTARYDATPAERQQATNSTFAQKMAEQMAPATQRPDIHELPTRPELRAHTAPRDRAKSDAPEIWISTVTAEPPMPRPPLAQSSTHDTVAMPRVEMPKYDGREAASEARQEAATQAVNQLTLKKAAGGELDIPELGKVKVGAETIGAAVDVRIQADRQETRTLVASHAREIALDARSAAIPVNGVRVEGASAGRMQMNFGSSQDAPEQQRNSRRDDETAQKAAFWMPSAKRARFVL